MRKKRFKIHVEEGKKKNGENRKIQRMTIIMTIKKFHDKRKRQYMLNKRYKKVVK